MVSYCMGFELHFGRICCALHCTQYFKDTLTFPLFLNFLVFCTGKLPGISCTLPCVPQPRCTSVRSMQPSGCSHPMCMCDCRQRRSSSGCGRQTSQTTNRARSRRKSEGLQSASVSSSVSVCDQHQWMRAANVCCHDLDCPRSSDLSKSLVIQNRYKPHNDVQSQPCVVHTLPHAHIVSCIESPTLHCPSLPLVRAYVCSYALLQGASVGMRISACVQRCSRGSKAVLVRAAAIDKCCTGCGCEGLHQRAYTRPCHRPSPMSPNCSSSCLISTGGCSPSRSARCHLLGGNNLRFSACMSAASGKACQLSQAKPNGKMHHMNRCTRSQGNLTMCTASPLQPRHARARSEIRAQVELPQGCLHRLSCELNDNVRLPMPEQKCSIERVRDDLCHTSGLTIWLPCWRCPRGCAGCAAGTLEICGLHLAAAACHGLLLPESC